MPKKKLEPASGSRLESHSARAYMPDRHLRFKTLALKAPLIDISPLLKTTSPLISSFETDESFTSPVKVVRSSQDLISVPFLRATRPTFSAFMNLSAFAEYVPAFTADLSFVPSSPIRLKTTRT